MPVIPGLREAEAGGFQVQNLPRQQQSNGTLSQNKYIFKGLGLKLSAKALHSILGSNGFKWAKTHHSSQ